LVGIVLIPKWNKYGSAEVVPEQDVVSDVNRYAEKAFFGIGVCSESCVILEFVVFVLASIHVFDWCA